MKIHLIAVGGAVMHNLAMALQQNGHEVTGSDDEIYNPARARLDTAGLLPSKMGWDENNIRPDLDIVILGMHARLDNPELARAQALGLRVLSYPAFIFEHAKAKTRVVVAGSHGKTTTTSMIMHVLRHSGRDFDYLVGAMLDGFETMVRLSDAPIMVIEGDEYLSSPLDRRPKIHNYFPHLSIITGIAWDHVNVFPTYENYVQQFDIFLDMMRPSEANILGGKFFYYKHDADLVKIAQKSRAPRRSYAAFSADIKDGATMLKYKGRRVPLRIFGDHNLANLKAAYLVCKELGVSDAEFFEAVKTFNGAAKRLQILCQTSESIAFLDFAHAPSKVKATVAAMKQQYEHRKLVACLELHTFSSLNKAFLPQYRHALAAADEAAVYFNEHTLTMKKMPPLSEAEVKAAFDHPNLKVFTDNQAFLAYLEEKKFQQRNLLLMTSGTFNGLELKTVAEKLLVK
ncbi:MAG: hypothetical protein RL757_894 [Bacteroidota bacterium]|jgi:UDP-N-acetylmuramate: L-alanyl-gamma-D-glutamyl-meso-diaminopimelate ligase